MREWKFTCRNFMFVRRMLDRYKDVETVPSEVCGKILEKLQYCIKTISRCYFKDENLYNSWIEDIAEDIEENSDMDTVNYRLEEFYDFCDDMEIWLPV